VDARKTLLNKVTKDAIAAGADRFDGALDDIFDLQDEVTASVVGVIGPKLEQAEIARAKRKPTESLDANDHYLRGIASYYQWTWEGYSEALRLFYGAIELDPDFASAHGMAAHCYSMLKVNGWMTNGAKEIAESERLARRAVALGNATRSPLLRAGSILPSSSATSTPASPSSTARSCSIRTWPRRGYSAAGRGSGSASRTWLSSTSRGPCA
jgi:hypothetical protein